MKKVDLLIVGVGGQGVILTGDIIGEAAMAAGYDVKKTDTLGMAQRGGSVISHVRIGHQVYSPLIKEAAADMLLSFEKLEAARWSHYLRPQGIAIVNNQTIPPLTVSVGYERYPSDEEITDILKRRTDRIYLVDGIRWARELGNIKTLNMLILGCASLFLPFKVHIWGNSIRQYIPPNIQQINQAAFDRGRKEIRSIHSG